MSVSSRRARVMARSQKLGHCICDPRQGCPCEALRAHNVCQCAGERLDKGAPAARVRARSSNPSPPSGSVAARTGSLMAKLLGVALRGRIAIPRRKR